MTPAQVAAALGITMLEAEMLIEAMGREHKRLAVRRSTPVGHADRVHVLGSLRSALRKLIAVLP